MTPLTLHSTAEARLKIRHLHPVLKQEIRSCLDQLAQNPWLGKPLQRELWGVYSLRAKNYRILYQIKEEQNRIELLTLGPRKIIYQNFSARQKEAAAHKN